jgi:hypothetical protein
MEDNSNVPQEDFSHIENIDLTDSNVDLSAPSPTSEPTTATQGADEAAAAQTEATSDETTKETDANTTEAKQAEGQQSEAEATAETEQTEQQQLSPEELQAQKAREAWQERQQRRQQQQQIEQQYDQAWQPKSAEDLVQEGVDPNQAAIEALRNELSFKEERARVSELNANLWNEATQVQKDFPVFDQNSKEYDPQFTQEVEQLYKTAARLQTMQVVGPNGQPTELVANADVPLYDFYQKMATIRNQGISSGAQQRQSAVQDMMARTENPGGSSSVNGPAADSLEAMEARLGDVVIT